MSVRVRLSHLRTRIIAWSFVPTTLILLAVALTIFYAYQGVTEDLVTGRNRELVRLAAGQLAAELSGYVEILSDFARSPGVSEGDPGAQAEELRLASNRLVVFDAGVTLLDNRGIVTAADPDYATLLGGDRSRRSYFLQIVRTSGPAFSDIVPDGVGGEEVISLAAPVFSAAHEFRGAVVGMFRLGASSFSAFYGDLVRLRIGGNGTTYVVDGIGRLIYGDGPERIGTGLADRDVVKRALDGQVDAFRTQSSQGEDILASYAPVPGTAWRLISEEEWAGLQASGQGYGRFLVALLALGVLLPTIVVGVGVRRITDPVGQLIVAAKQVAGGHLGQQIVLHTGDELEELATQFNLMSNEIALSYAELEQRVAARTRELGTLNAISGVVSRSLDLKEILTAALEKTMEVIGSEVGEAYRLTEDGESLILMADRGLSPGFVAYTSRLLLGTALAGKKVAADTLLTWSIEDYPAGEMKQQLLSEGLQVIIGVPLMVKDRLVGGLVIGSRQERELSVEESSLLIAIGRQIGVAMENARLYEQAEQSAALAERTRLARDLHDSVTQSLYSVTLYAEAAARMIAEGMYSEGTGLLRELRDTAQEALREMRLLIFELRPPALEQRGLIASLQVRLEAVEARAGSQVKLEVEGEEYASAVPLGVQDELYRLAQEALNNILKHARARTINLHLTFGEKMTCLEIQDDGIGFDQSTAGERGGFGLSGMRERAQRIGAELTIESMLGKGTHVRVCVPLPQRFGEPRPQGPSEVGGRA